MTVPFVDMQRLHGPLRGELMEAFTRVLDSGSYVQGWEVASLEAEFEKAYPCSHAVALSNGTTALHVALIAAGIGPGDEVITVANTFIATVEAIWMAGATPVFADISADGYLMDIKDVERKITPRTKAVVPVHLYGEVADVDALRQLVGGRDIRIIEDACQAHGAALRGEPAGTLGDVGCLSFYPTKNMGAVGEGGMLITSDAAIAARARTLRDHGQTTRHHHVEPGFNYRMPELQAASLRVMLPHLGAWNRARQSVAAFYREALHGSGVMLPPVPHADSDHVYHLFVVRHPDRSGLMRELQGSGIGVAIHYPVPIHLQPAFERYGGGLGSLPNTEQAVAEILSLPMHPTMASEQAQQVVDALDSFVSARKGAVVGAAQ